MHPILLKTFGGLSRAYYFRQLFFGSLFFALFMFLLAGGKHFNVPFFIFILLNTLLYPFARFVYEAVTGFIMGNNSFFTSFSTWFIIKYFSMALTWAFSVFLAPLGLIYLYFHHSNNEKRLEQE